MSTPVALSGDKECAKRKDRRHPGADEDSVEFVVHRPIVGEEQPNAEHEAGRCCEERGYLQNFGWFHAPGLTDSPWS